MKLRTALLLAGLGVLAARRATQARRRPTLLLEAGPQPPAALPQARERPEPVEVAPAPPSISDAVSPQAPPAGVSPAGEAEAPAAASWAWGEPGLEREQQPPEDAERKPKEAWAGEPLEESGTPPEEHEPAAPPHRSAATRPPEEAEATDFSLPDTPAEGTPPGWTVVYPDGDGESDGELQGAAAVAVATRPELRDLAGIRRFFLANTTPLVYVGPTPFPLLGLDRSLGRFSYVSFHDCFDGRHGSVFVPSGGQEVGAFASVEEATNALLADHEVVERLRDRDGRLLAAGHDRETERLAAALGWELAAMPAAMLERLEDADELETFASEAGVRAAPAATTPLSSSRDRRPMEGRLLLVEAVATRHGAVVGPVVADLSALDDLPSRCRGICVSDVAAALSSDMRVRLRGITVGVGERLVREGYRGGFRVDVLVDRLDETTLAGVRLRPTLTGALGNVAALAEGDVPLVLLHLLALSDADHSVDVGALNEQWSDARPGWGFLVLKNASAHVEVVTEAPASGVWRFDASAHGGIRYTRPDIDWRGMAAQDEAYFLRIARAGRLRYPGLELGIVVARTPFVTDDGTASDQTTRWARGLAKNVWTAPAPSAAGDVGSTPFDVAIV